MKGKGRTRLIEWGKSLLIVLLAISAAYLLGRTQFSEDVVSEVKGLLDRNSSSNSEELNTQTAPAVIHPMHIAINLDGGQRYGVQYDQKGTDAVFSSVSTLLSEALSSADTPRRITEQSWRTKLTGAGIYMDFYYPVSLNVLSEQLGEGQGNPALSGKARRICLAADQNDGVSLLYINEADGLAYSSVTTLSRTIHLDPVLEGQSPNGALFAFEVPGMEHTAPYMLLTSTPKPVVYQSGNPLLNDTARIEELLHTLSFQSRGAQLDPAAGGPLVEGNDSLRLFETGLLTFHTIGDSDFRFLLPEQTMQSALEYTQKLANATVGVWCGGANLCLAGVEETGNGTEILFQYCLNGIPVELPEGNVAARFLVYNGALTDFSLYFRAYTATEETTLILPELQAAAIMDAAAGQEDELTLLYRDMGGESVSAGWVAN